MLLRFEILLEQVNHKLDAISTKLQNQSAGRAASEARHQRAERSVRHAHFNQRGDGYGQLHNRPPLPGAVNYIQEAGSFYDTAEEAAALIRQTESWNDEQWRHAYLRSVERAFGNFISTEVLAQIVSDWRSITGKTADVNLSEQHWERRGAGLRGAFG